LMFALAALLMLPAPCASLAKAIVCVSMVPGPTEAAHIK
jgi:hypothetical protein